MAIRTEPKTTFVAAWEKVIKSAPAVRPSPVEAAILASRPKSVGRPPSGKMRVTLLLDPEVIAKFKADGPGWQARMNEALKR